MSRKRVYNYSHIGKNKKPYDSKITSLSGEANLNLDTYDKRNGRFVSRRRYGDDGSAQKDLDVADSHKKYDHAHDFKNGSRLFDRPLTKKERHELKKAKRKRSFFNDFNKK